jgi:hypothetical protein
MANMLGIVEIQGQNVTLRRAYSSISSQFAHATPSPTRMADYTPTIPFPTCSDMTFPAGRDGQFTITSAFTIASTLPNPPYPPLCHCMARTLSCIADPARNISANYVGMLSSCKADPAYCRAVTSDGRAGFYPSYRFCNMTERASWSLNQMYLASGGSDPAVCTAAGGALQSPTLARLAGLDCEALMRQAGPAGTGTITYTPGLPRAGGAAPPPSGGGVHLGGVVGGVLAGVAAVALAAGLALWHRARRKAARPRAAHEVEDALPAEAKVGPGGEAELDGTEQVEIGGSETYEMAADAEPLELDGAGDQVYELEGEGSVSGVVSGPVSPLTAAGTPKSTNTWAESTR